MSKIGEQIVRQKTVSEIVISIRKTILRHLQVSENSLAKVLEDVNKFSVNEVRTELDDVELFKQLQDWFIDVKTLIEKYSDISSTVVLPENSNIKG